MPLLSTTEGWINEEGFTNPEQKIEFDIEKKFSDAKWYANHFYNKGTTPSFLFCIERDS